MEHRANTAMLIVEVEVDMACVWGFPSLEGAGVGLKGFKVYGSKF
jgi:hypothetical protein